MLQQRGAYTLLLVNRWEVFEELMGYVGQHELMQSCHPVLIAYLQLLAGLAGDDLGAQEVMNQLQLQVRLRTLAVGSGRRVCR